MVALSPDQFQEVLMDKIPVVEDLLTLNFVISDLSMVVGNINEASARRILEKIRKD